MNPFYEQHNIKVVSDGIGNTVWTYKDIEIAYYLDMEEPDGHIYVAYHWWVNKHPKYGYDDCKIEPLYKIHGKWINNIGECNEPINMKFDDENSKEFHDALLISIGYLESRLQVLKGKVTMFKKHRLMKLDVFDAIRHLSEKQQIYMQNNVGKTVTLCNGHEMIIKEYKTGKFKRIGNVFDDSRYYVLVEHNDTYIVIDHYLDRWWKNIIKLNE